MTAEQQQDQSYDSGQKSRVILFWAFVGVPLAWGIIETFIKAAQLFG